MGLFGLLVLLLVVLGVASSQLGFAKYFGTIAVSRIQGKVGEVTYKRWKTGVNVVQQVSSGVRNPNSPSQMLQRQVFSVFAKEWFTVLTAPQRTLWNSYALTKPGMYACGQGVRELVGSNGGIMSGQNAFILTNAWWVSCGLPGLAIPPIAGSSPTVINDLDVQDVIGVITLTWTSAVAEVGAISRIWVASVSGLFHKQIVDVPVDATGTTIISQVKGAKGEFLDLADLPGERLYVQMDTVNPSGGKSAGSNTFEFLIV